MEVERIKSRRAVWRPLIRANIRPSGGGGGWPATDLLATDALAMRGHKAPPS
jgi:hypothetical protein